MRPFPAYAETEDSMNVGSGKRRLRRSFSYIALVGVLALSAVGLSQCRLVDQTVTGVDLKANAAFGGGEVDCKKTCNEEFKDCKQAESERHKAAKKACDQLSGADKKACKDAESQRNKDEKKACSERKKACKAACNYREGSGSGGH
jgi:hypothetical protein